MSENKIQAVTGAFGYSGKYIAQRLLDAGQQVITLTNSPGRANTFGKRVKAFPFNFDQPDELIESLTPRESEVLQLLAQGMPNKQIALELAISEHTVKYHVNAILGKLGAQSRTEAVVRATRAGLILL